MSRLRESNRVRSPARRAGPKQHPNGVLHLDGFDSLCSKKDTTRWVVSFLEQDTGVEPAFTAWEAVVLPIYESCVWVNYSKGVWKKQPLFVEGIAAKGQIW